VEGTVPSATRSSQAASSSSTGTVRWSIISDGSPIAVIALTIVVVAKNPATSASVAPEISMI
jgi:hypothetical protein